MQFSEFGLTNNLLTSIDEAGFKVNKGKSCVVAESKSQSTGRRYDHAGVGQ